MIAADMTCAVYHCSHAALTPRYGQTLSGSRVEFTLASQRVFTMKENRVNAIARRIYGVSKVYASCIEDVGALRVLQCTCKIA